MKGTIYYVYDPLCSWCYGFSPVIKKLKNEYADDFFFEVVSGGMQTGDRQQPISEIKDYLKDAYKKVSERTGAEFGDEFMKVLEEGKRELNSVPGSVALEIVKDLEPSKTLDFAALIQEAIYKDGIDWNKAEAFAPYAEKLGVDPNLFTVKAKNEAEYTAKAAADFQRASEFGVSGFPSVVVKHQDDTQLIAQGYKTFDELKAKMEEVLEKS